MIRVRDIQPRPPSMLVPCAQNEIDKAPLCPLMAPGVRVVQLVWRSGTSPIGRVVSPPVHLPRPPQAIGLDIFELRSAVRELFHWARDFEIWMVECHHLLQHPAYEKHFAAIGQRLRLEFEVRRAEIMLQYQCRGDQLVHDILSSIGTGVQPLLAQCALPTLPLYRGFADPAARSKSVEIPGGKIVPGVSVPSHARELAQLFFVPLEAAAIRMQATTDSSLTYIVPPEAAAHVFTANSFITAFCRYWPYDPKNSDLAFVLKLLNMRMSSTEESGVTVIRIEWGPPLPAQPSSSGGSGSKREVMYMWG